MGRVGLHWKDGNMSLLSLCGGTESTERADSSQFWSALLPFVVALTAVAALCYPSSFTWQEEEVSRTISLCTGMQSSTLVGLLATQFLGSSQAVPTACFVVVMAIMGLCLASFWGNGFRIKDVLSLLTPQGSGYITES